MGHPTLFKKMRWRSSHQTNSHESVELIGKSDQVQDAWTNRNLNKFKACLDGDWTDDELGVLGEILSSIAMAHESVPEDIKEYARALLEKNVDADVPDRAGNCAIHYAAEWGNLPVLEVLLEANANPNAADSAGLTALHLLADFSWTDSIQPHLECLQLLLSRSDVNINAVDYLGATPVHRAALSHYRKVVDIFMEKASLIDWDGCVWRGKTPRQALVEKYPDLESKIPPPKVFVMNTSKMLSLLQNKNEDEFCTELRDNYHQYEETKDLFLQKACEKDLEEAVQILVGHGANPFKTAAWHQDYSSVCMAIENGNTRILETLLSSAKPEKVSWPLPTPLHVAATHCHLSSSHAISFQMILQKMKEEEQWIDVNEKDTLGNTALFYAVSFGNESAIAEILRLGGYMTAENYESVMPLPRIPHEILQQFLDENLTHTPALSEYMEEIFRINYCFLKPPIYEDSEDASTKKTDVEKNVKKEREESVPETKQLLLMSRLPALRPLLTHPVLRIFIMLKWRLLRSIFLVNLAFYSALCIYLTVYILWMAAPWEIKGDSDAVSDLMASRVILGCLLVMLTFREIFQSVISPKRYFTHYENYLELLLIGFGGYITIQDCSRSFTPKAERGLLCPHFGAAIILISWLELLLLLGKLPVFAVQVEMFSLVFLSFLKFLYVYLIMILAFALSFFVLFRECEDGCDDNAFTDIVTSVFKTIVMVSGEFEWGNIPFPTYFYSSHIIFTIFVFLIAIVLLNLLNGLAVHDVKEIHDDAVLQSSVARIKYICSLEELLQGARKWGRFGHFLSRKFLEFPETISIHSSEGRNRIICPVDDPMKKSSDGDFYYFPGLKETRCRYGCTRCDLDFEVVQVARESLQAMAERSKPDNVQEIIEESKKQTKAVEEINQTSRETLDTTSKKVEAMLVAVEQSKEKNEEILKSVEESRNQSDKLLEALEDSRRTNERLLQDFKKQSEITEERLRSMQESIKLMGRLMQTMTRPDH